MQCFPFLNSSPTTIRLIISCSIAKTIFSFFMEQKSYFLEFSIDHAQFLPKVVVQACPLPECFSLEEQTPTLPKAAILSSCLPLFLIQVPLSTFSTTQTLLIQEFRSYKLVVNLSDLAYTTLVLQCLKEDTLKLGGFIKKIQIPGFSEKQIDMAVLSLHVVLQ